MKEKIRITPQTKAVLEYVHKSGHATNRQILYELNKVFPNLSATTVHRITLRMVSCGMLAKGPEIEGSMTVDSNLKSHDHFICNNCEGLKDVILTAGLRRSLQTQTGLSILPSNLVIYGDCTNCKTKNYA
ncbi:MAG: transcriptional repressor [Candidatus Saccharibacteria bacterium]